MINGHLALAKEVLPAALDWHETGAPAVPIRGDELAAELGIERGPPARRADRDGSGRRCSAARSSSSADAVGVAREALAERGE